MESVDRGSVLMVVLWLVAILGLVAFALAFHTRTELRLTAFQWDQERLTQAAKMKAAQAMSLIEKSSAPLTLGELSRWNAALFPTKSEASPAPLFVTDEHSRINLNTASKDILERLTGYRDVTAAILDWRDPDSLLSPGGAENTFYQSLSNPYPCRNGPFKSVAELLLVKGMTPDLYQEIKNNVTVEDPGTVNINTASKQTLSALGASSALIGKILNARKGPDGMEGTGDDLVFTKLNAVPEQLGKRWPLTASDELSWQGIEEKLSVQGKALRLQFTATLDDSFSTRRIEMVLNPGDSRPVRSWGEK
jgi:general secretion pathway protein K